MVRTAEHGSANGKAQKFRRLQVQGQFGQFVKTVSRKEDRQTERQTEKGGGAKTQKLGERKQLKERWKEGRNKRERKREIRTRHVTG